MIRLPEGNDGPVMFSSADPSAPGVVADVIWEAATETGSRLRFRAGADAVELLDRRKQQDDATFIGAIKDLMKE